jgi:transmembrane sensor
MTQVDEEQLPPSDPLEEAADWFVRLRDPEVGVEQLVQFQRWAEADPGNAAAYARVSRKWSAVGEHASAPEIMTARQEALQDARDAARNRWDNNSTRSAPRWRRPVIAAAAALLAGVGLWAYWSQSQADIYTTAVGQRSILTLADGSIVTLDARSRLEVKYDRHERLIVLDSGQARFDVARDVSRPFRVKAANQTVLALGTQFNVELVAHSVLVTLIEGRVAVTPDERDPQLKEISLNPGEGIQVHLDDKAVRKLPRVDVNKVTAWQNGRLFLEQETLASAAERVNRYASKQVEVDSSAANIVVSGVFKAGDIQAFVEAVTAYFPVKAEEFRGTTVRLSARDP